jgi:hypothetical protein
MREYPSDPPAAYKQFLKLREKCNRIFEKLRSGSQEPPNLLAVFKHQNRDIRAVLLEAGCDTRHHLFLKGPDVTKEIPFEPFRATWRHVRARPPDPFQPPRGDTPEAEPSPQAHPDDDIGARQTDIEARRIGSVHQPAVAGDAGVLSDATAVMVNATFVEKIGEG